ncbi:hypothetical protein SBF1_1330016 [Candidatus Desulfosporosinus infrequens]|uniref:Uncharacterized protein n=1 Tax=Candidatus Desulfosporosinus infrequens TaxID=2043169 RepID=A0A2U3K480_9FIRM|nr:hypothetical protein SBF1_1330016 [Candidatus Desulfosporosinus infrequens]
MDTLLFGISGLPLGNGFTKFSYASGIYTQDTMAN